MSSTDKSGSYQPSSSILTVVIPVKNGAGVLSDCLDSIYSQTVADRLEVLIIDSGSTDHSLKLISNYNRISVRSVGAANFNHGKTRQEALVDIGTAFVLFTVQDAKLADSRIIERMLSHFDDPKVAAVCGKQIVDESRYKNPLSWYRPQHVPDFKKVSWLYEDGVSHLFELTHWDNVCALYRADVLRKIPFRELIFGEDRRWAKEALESGHVLVYDNRCSFIHYHHESYQDRYKRALLVYFFEFKTFGKIRKESYSPWSNFIKPALLLIKRGQHPKWIFFNWKLEWASWRAYRLANKVIHSNEMKIDDFLDQMRITGIPIGKLAASQGEKLN